MKAENLSKVTGTSRARPPPIEQRGCGGMESLRKPSRRSWIPILIDVLLAQTVPFPIQFLFVIPRGLIILLQFDQALLLLADEVVQICL